MIQFENIRVCVYSDTLLRLEYQPEKKFIDSPTLLMGVRRPEESPARAEKKKNRLILRTEKCELVYSKKKGTLEGDKLEVTFLRGSEKVVWKPGMSHTRPVPEVYRSLDEWPQGVRRAPQPILVNSDGWHCIEDNSSVYWDAEKNWPSVRRHADYRNMYLFFYGADVRAAFRDFILLFGQPPLVPRQAFGAWCSRWHDYKDSELLQLIDEYREGKVPLDVLVVDVDWHRHRWNGYDWRGDSFPDPAAFIRQIRERGLKLVLNDHPGYDSWDPLPDDDSRLPALRQELKEAPYRGQWACDWSRASVAEQWRKKCLQDLLAQGIDWWWIDGWGDTPFPGIDGQMWLNWQYYQAIQEHRPGKRALILSRWGGVGSHRYPVQFSGDTHSNFPSLEFQIHYTAYSGGIGAYYWSHDIGGFHEHEVDEELYVRWVQFGALSPIFRTHSNHGIREPFRFSDRTLGIYRKYMNLRYQLVPYFEQLQRYTHVSGFPLVYPMYFAYPEREEAHAHTGQYFLGPCLIVAPIAEPVSPQTGLAAKNVWLPPGEWLDTMSGEWIPGDRVVSKEVSIEQVPLFVRKGSVLPTMPLKSPIPEGAHSEITLYLFDRDGEQEKTFHFDDGIAFDSLEESSSLKLHIRPGERETSVRCEPGPCREFLPAMIHFALFATAKPSQLARSGRKTALEELSAHLLSDICANKLECVRWSISSHDLGKSVEWKFR